MDFKREVIKLVDMIPKGYVSTPSILADSLGDQRAVKAVLEVLRQDPEHNYRIIRSRTIRNSKQREMLAKDGIRFEAESIKDYREIIFNAFPGAHPLEKLRNEQNRLSKKIIQNDDFEKIERICGIDVAYNGDIAYGELAIFDFASMNLIELKTRTTKTTFPYIPTYLAYREFDAVKDLVKTLNNDEDLLLVDASGMLHPRNLGLASYVGVKFNLITIGVTKNLLCGALKTRPKRTGDSSEIIYRDEIRGYALKNSKSNKLIYISIGNRISLKTSLEIVKKSSFKRIPEPLRVAHISAKKLMLANTLKQ